MDEEELKKIKECLSPAGLLKNAVFYQDLSEITTIRSGGKCLCFLRIKTRKDLLCCLKSIIGKNIDYLIIGDGSNILFGEKLHKLLVIRLDGEFAYLRFTKDNLIKVGAGYNLQKFVVKTAKNGFDFSFLGGIPGTLGGAVIGNSGTGATGINSSVRSIDYICAVDNEVTDSKLNIGHTDFNYRTLNIGMPAVITDITLQGYRISSKYAIERLRERIKTKKRIQPLGTKNAGCFFKNPEDGKTKAGILIDNCNLKGFSYGGAKVSEKHANFIENSSDASPGDIFILSKIVRDSVEKKYGIKLEYEVKMVGIDEK
jgi:UDP-N-acetylmuramate dehydrogenase